VPSVIQRPRAISRQPILRQPILRQRNFRLLWCAGLISITGDWALRIALPIYVLRLTGSATAVSTVVLSGLVASLAIGTVAGPYVDRWDRRRVLVLVNALQALVLVPLLTVRGADRLWVVIAVAFAEAALSQFLVPAENALLPRLVSPDQLTTANALNNLSNFLGRLIGPAIGGLVAAALGLGGAAMLDAGTFAVAAMLCALISGDHGLGDHKLADRGLGDDSVAEIPTEQRERHLRRELIEGIRAIGRNRIARAVLIFITITAVGEGMMSTLFAVFVTRALHVGSREMGWMLSAQAVGGILGSLALARATATRATATRATATRVTAARVTAAREAARFRPMSLAWTNLAVFGLIDLAIFNYPRWDTALWPVIGLFFLIGAPGAIGSAALITLFQAEMPDRMRGRAFAVIGVCSAFAGMVGAGIAGALGQTVSAVNLLTAQGAGYLFAAILLRIMSGQGPDRVGPDRVSPDRVSPDFSRSAGDTTAAVQPLR
jgi:MFS family permease